MDPELKKLLEQNLAIAKDNNAILRSMRHHQWLSSIVSLLFWVGAIAIPLYLYQQYLQPVVSRFYPAFGLATSSPFGMYGFPSSAEMQKLINSYKSGQQ